MPSLELSGSSHRVSFEDNATCALLFGQHNLNLSRIEQKLPVTLVSRGNEVFIKGASDSDVHAAAAVLEELYAKLRKGIVIDREEVDAAVRMIAHQVEARDQIEHVQIRTDRKIITPRSLNQIGYVRALEQHELVFALGPAGTGKTYLAVAMAVAFLKQRRVERLVLSRPAVEAGEKLGFLPGTLEEKVDPYLRPLYDALHDMLPDGKLQQKIASGQIEIAPLAYMRGRTLSNAFVILDEAQNTTSSQMKMFLTRLGENSRMVVTGDPTQSDLGAGVASGLADAVDRLGAIRGIGMVRFAREDIVRHPLVTEIIEAYEQEGPRGERQEERARRSPRTPPASNGQ